MNTGANAIIVSPVAPFPASSGNRARISDFYLRLRAAGIRTTLVYVDIVPGDPTVSREVVGDDRFVFLRFRRKDMAFQARRRLGDLYRWMAGIWPPLRKVVGAARRPHSGNLPLGWYFDPEVFERIESLIAQLKPKFVLFEYAIWGTYAKKLSGKSSLIVDTHDRLANRNALVPGASTPYSLSPEDERSALAAFDAVIAIQSDEASYFESLAKHVVTIGHVVEADAVPSVGLTSSTGVLFLGGNNAVNVATLRRIQGLWPAIRSAVPSAHLIIAGDISELAERAQGITILGRLGELRAFYSMGRVVLNPVPFGTGLKIKNIEALAHGLPVVTTAVGAEGIDQTRSGLLVADTDDAIIAAVISVLASQELTLRLHLEALAFVSAWNTTHSKAFESLFEITPATG